MKKISLIITILGILLILFIANTLPTKEGIVKKISKNQDYTTITLSTQNETLVIFKEIQGITPGDKIKFYGEEQYYNGQKQIVAKKIILLKK